MSKLQIINFNQQTTNNREATKMETSVISLPAGLDAIMEKMVITHPNTGIKKTSSGIKVPQGPHHRPKGKHAGGTRYTEEFLATIVRFIYDDGLTLKQIADILNHYGKTSAHNKKFTANIVYNALDTHLAWSLIEPRWIQWQLDNSSLFSDQD
jgi:hypothetical protein